MTLFIGIVVLRPVVEGRRYDLVFDVDHELFRVQCKWAPRRGAIIDVHLATCRHTPRGYVYTTYGPDEVDAIAVYCQELKRCYWLPIDMVAARPCRPVPYRSGTRPRPDRRS